ncbi:hypothetical protein PoB_003785800 [Plakobranchus ocellatus]|uniref:Uncharacterized protein n=1 Tax=Plakobranchus ocellatus TaxID=259542 RepID=A0AAV4AXY7_9GAST|nr:hypothetical protein PoB_003785800 [Plakobranchus ocellatus]
MEEVKEVDEKEMEEVRELDEKEMKRIQFDWRSEGDFRFSVLRRSTVSVTCRIQFDRRSEDDDDDDDDDVHDDDDDDVEDDDDDDVDDKTVAGA